MSKNNLTNQIFLKNNINEIYSSQNLSSLDIFPQQKNGNINTDLIEERLRLENTNQSNGKRCIDFSEEISLDQVERKLNRFSIAKDSLESSLANLPYSIEDSINYFTDKKLAEDTINEGMDEFETPVKQLFLNGIQEYSTAEKTKFSNKLNDLQKSFIHTKNISNNDISKIINNSFNKNSMQPTIAINNFINTAKSKNTGNLSTDVKEKNLNSLNNDNCYGNNQNFISTSTQNQTSHKTSENKMLKFNLKFNTTEKTIIEKNENEKSDEEENDVERTAKIKYKHITKIFEGTPKEEKIDERKNKYFWFGAYDKLMREKNIKKIINFYERDRNEDKMSMNANSTNISKNAGYNNKKLKEIPIILKDYEIYFEIDGGQKGIPKTTKAYLKSKKDGLCFLNLYYLNIEQFNMIYNYINKTNCELKINNFENTNNPGDTTELNKSKKYSDLICLGSVINSNIYSFTKKYNEKPAEKAKPKVKYLVKLIKNLCKIFKNYSYEFFMYHIYSKTGMNQNLTPHDMQIIRSYFLKENNLKELDIHVRNKDNKHASKNNASNTFSNSNVDMESLDMKIKCTSQKNSDFFNFNPHNLYDENSKFINNDSIDIDLEKNYFGLRQKNNKRNNQNCIDVSNNAIYNNPRVTSGVCNDSLESDKFHCFKTNKQKVFDDTQNKFSKIYSTINKDTSGKQPTNMKNFITPSEFNSSSIINNKEIKKNLFSDNKYIHFDKSNKKSQNFPISRKNKFQKKLIKNSNEKNSIFKNPTKNDKSIVMANIISPNDTYLESRSNININQNDTIDQNANYNVNMNNNINIMDDCSNNNFFINFASNNKNTNEPSNRDSFFNKRLIESSLLLNSEVSKYPSNSKVESNLINQLNRKNVNNQTNFSNSILDSNFNNIININKKSFISGSEFNSQLKNLDDKFSARLNNVNKINSVLNSSNIQPRQPNNFNKNGQKSEVGKLNNKMNLNFLSSLNNSKISSLNGLNNPNLNNSNFNNNYFLKAKAELSHAENEVKLVDNSITSGKNLDDETKLNNYEESNKAEEKEKVFCDSKNNVSDYSNKNSTGKNKLNLSNGRKKVSTPSENENIFSPLNNNLKTSNNSNNNSNNIGNNLKSHSKNMIPLNKSKMKDLDIQNYSQVKNIRTSEENQSTEKKNLNSQKNNGNNFSNSNKRNSFKKVENINKNAKIIENNLKNNLKNVSYFSATNNRNYNTDDISFNIRQSYNSMNRSIRNENNSNIFVVSRDNGSRFKTEFDDSDDSDNDNLNTINGSASNVNLTTDNNISNYNTPTKKRILKYYS